MSHVQIRLAFLNRVHLYGIRKDLSIAIRENNIRADDDEDSDGRTRVQQPVADCNNNNDRKYGRTLLKAHLRVLSGRQRTSWGKNGFGQTTTPHRF